MRLVHGLPEAHLRTPKGSMDHRLRTPSLGLLPTHCRRVGGLSVFYRLLFGFLLTLSALSCLCPSQVFAGCAQSTSHPIPLKLPKSRITAHLLSFVPPFLTHGTNFPSLFSPILSSRTSRYLFPTSSVHPSSVLMISSTSNNHQIPNFLYYSSLQGN